MIFLKRFKKYIKVTSGGIYRYTGTDFYEKILCCMINRAVIYDLNLIYSRGSLYQAKINNGHIKISCDKYPLYYDYMIKITYYDKSGKKMVLSIWCKTKLNGELILPYSVNKFSSTTNGDMDNISVVFVDKKI